MKTIEELGISPSPWNIDGPYVESAHGTPIATFGTSELAERDERLISAAPELYEALRKIVFNYCLGKGNPDYCKGCPNDCKCDFKECIAVIQKASGESEARVWCKYDATRNCVDCEICADESEVAK